MSEVKLVVRDWIDAVSGTVHGSMADRVVAALSADPVTIAELDMALVRFLEIEIASTEKCTGKERRLRRWLYSGLDDRPYDAGLVVIDLAARLIVVDSTYSSPTRRGTIFESTPDGLGTRCIDYHLDNDWAFSSCSETWQCLADSRRSERGQPPDFDPRSVLFGQPLLEFLLNACLDAFPQRERIAAETRPRLVAEREQRAPWQQREPRESEVEFPITELYYDLFRDIHATWLMTPRADLNDRSPRDVLTDKWKHISTDIDDRYAQWLVTDRCPPPLSTSSHAWRLAGFGTVEIVFYYKLIRALLARCWEDLELEIGSASNATYPSNPSNLGDRQAFVQSKLAELALFRDDWLAAPDSTIFGNPPIWFIERERRRFPPVIAGPEMMPDCDCPLCQMMLDSAPMVIDFNGKSMDDDFAFDFSCRTIDEWEQQQTEKKALNEQAAIRKEVERELGLSRTPDDDWLVEPGEDHDGWKQDAQEANAGSQTVAAQSVSSGLWLFDLGSELAEVIVALRGARNEFREARLPQIEELNRHFANVRAAVGRSTETVSCDLLEPVTERFRDALLRVASQYPEAAEVCDSVLDFLSEPLGEA